MSAKWGKSIRTQLISVILLMTTCSLALGMLAYGFNYYQNSQQSLISRTQGQAALIATNAVLPMLQGNESKLVGLLQSVQLGSAFNAAIYDNTGRILARKNAQDTEIYLGKLDFNQSKGEKVSWQGDLLLLSRPVSQADGEQLGSLVFKVSTDKFYSGFQRFSMVNFAIMAGLLVGVYLISLRLQKGIAGPLEELEGISRQVSGSNNYSIRVPQYGDDEIGSLARSFNQMLETIEKNQQERDSANAALKLNKKRLEKAVQDLQYLANYDSLTQLPNRALCIDRIKNALKRAARSETMVAILFLDLDHFKDVNDSLGHAVGDKLLKATSKRLLKTIRDEDTLARLGGDEFVIILNQLEGTDSVISIVEKIVDGFERPFKLSNYEVNTTVSVGVCMYPQDGEDVDTLMKAADAAMYKAKELGRNTYEFYEMELNQLAIRRHQLANELRQAIKNNELSLVFQPQLNIRSNRVTGAEALLRWRHPILGSIAPSEFIQIAENTGLIKEIGNWVLDQACAKIAACRDAGNEIRLAVNLSALQFRQADLPETIARILQKHRIPARLLEVEITESMLMRDVSQAIDLLERLKEMQIRIAIDDFGTGYSSLSYLRRFPLDALKIDRSFIDELVVDSDDTAITMAVISMAKSLRLDVIAEGVETEQQQSFLAQNYCDEIQGYYFAKPMTSEEFDEFLKNQQQQRLRMSQPAV